MITAEMIRQLRDKTDEQLIVCKKALEMFSGNSKAAEDFLRTTPHHLRFSELDQLRTENAALKAELETERMRLVACGVIALANTRESAVTARQMKPEYWSASAQEVASTVDREMELREAVERLKAELDALKEKATLAESMRKSVIDTLSQVCDPVGQVIAHQEQSKMFPNEIVLVILQYGKSLSKGDKLYTAPQPAQSKDAEDAARYRFLRYPGFAPLGVVTGTLDPIEGEELDAAIDAAMEKKA